jgi:hypothetical protein
MKVSDLPTGQCFVFKDDVENPYLRVDTGYVNFETEFFESVLGTEEAIKIDKWVVYKAMITFEVPQYEVDILIAKYIEQYKTPAIPVDPKYATLAGTSHASDITAKIEYQFSCAKCKKDRRSSYFLEKAEGKICRKCLRSLPDPNQVKLFEGSQV